MPIKYVKGKNLHSKIINTLKYCTWEVLDKRHKIKMIGYFIQITEYLKEMHKSGYIHRDITASNFLIDKAGRIYFIDLELMYSERENEPNPPFKVGTPGYMSPEQSRSQQPSASDDIYSFGALLCALSRGDDDRRTETQCCSGGAGGRREAERSCRDGNLAGHDAGV